MDNILDRAEEIINIFTICNYGDCVECPYGDLSTGNKCVTLNFDLLALIRALQSELAKVTAERDAAMADVRRECATCALCSQNNKTGEMCEWAFNCNQIDGDHWEWRGVQDGGIIANSGD